VNEPRNVVALLQRVADLGVQLVGNRIELASAELRASTVTAGRRLLVGAAGALVAAVGVALAALALVEGLAPLIEGRALRLLLVGAPLILGGALVLARASGGGGAGSAADHGDRQQHDGDHQQHVDPGAEGVAAHHAEQP
jgi:hypothetical protein